MKFLLLHFMSKVFLLQSLFIPIYSGGYKNEQQLIFLLWIFIIKRCKFFKSQVVYGGCCLQYFGSCFIGWDNSDGYS